MKPRFRFVWIIAACVILAAPAAFAQETPDAPAPATGPEAFGQGEGAPAPDGAPTLEPADEQTPEGEPTPGEGDDRPPPQGFDMKLILLMVGVLVLFYVISGRGRKKREAKHREMLASLRKGDKVTSIGGVCGTIMEVKEDEITVKVDETNNIRMRFARWAIRGVGDTAKSERPEDNRK